MKIKKEDEYEWMNEYEVEVRLSERGVQGVATTLPQSTLEETISEKWLQFIMQLENPRKGSSISFFLVEALLAMKAKTNISIFFLGMI